MLLAAPASATSLRSGEGFAARYRIEALLGRCGSFEVYRVLDEQTGERRALKWLPTTGASSKRLSWQLEREYQTLSQLASPSLVQVHDAGFSDASSYYTLELLDGDDLQECGKLPFRVVCRLIRDVADSLATLHAHRLLHRDVCARNVRSGGSDRAKLFDFGALAPAGAPGRPIGTPAYVAPEAARLQALDARSDLFALGALLYWSLSGRNAYAARSFSQLEAAWRTPPPPPSRYAAEVPTELDELVVQLLALDRTLRPTSAAWVAERLASIGELGARARTDPPHVPAIVPNLVGRTAELGLLKGALERASQGRGTAILLESDEGFGRSRLLDEAILESKQLAAVVIRGDASEGPSPYALVRSLATQLYQVLPDVAAQAAAPRRAWLAQLAIELTPEAILDGPAQSDHDRMHGLVPTLERSALNATARDWFLSVARNKHLVIAVDDGDRADEPSMAILAMLAHGAPRRRLSIFITSKRNAAAPSAPLSVIRSVASVLTLTRLPTEEGAALAHSLLTPMADRTALASEIERTAEGSPSWIVALAELIALRETTAHDAVRAASAHPRSSAPPETRSEVLKAWVAALDEDGRELAQALALATQASVPITAYVALTLHREARRIHRAVATLERSGFLVSEADHHRFRDTTLAALLVSGIEAEHARALHARIAEALRRDEYVAERFKHLVLAGDERHALDCLLRVPVGAAALRDVQLDRAALDRVLATALHPPTLEDAQPRLHELLLQITADMGDTTAFLRVTEALRVQFDGARVPAVSPRLAELLLPCITLADAARDATPLRRLPAFGALGVSGLRLVDAAVGVHHPLLEGHEALALRRSRELLRLLDTPDAGGDPQLIDSVRRRQQYLQGLNAAALGMRATTEWILELERSHSHRAYAFRVRAMYELAHGRFESGLACSQRAELLALQDGVEDPLPGTSLSLELFLVLHAEDRRGLARLLPRALALAARAPGFEPIASIARAYALLPEAPDAALAGLAPLLTRLVQSPDPYFAWIATAHLQVLRRLGRAQEAVDAGALYVDAWSRSGLGPRDLGLRQALAEAQLELGRAADARKTNREDLRNLEEVGMRGLVPALARITRARIALALEDVAEARTYASRGLRDCPGTESPRLAAALTRLRKEAERSYVRLELTVHDQEPEAAVPPVDEEARALFKRLLSCVSAPERAKEALRLLLDDVGAATGYLFALRGGRLRCLASTEPREAPADLVALLEDTLRVELEQDSGDALAAPPHELSSAYLRFIDDWGREFEPLLLFGRTQGEPVLTGIAALHYELARRSQPRVAVVEALTEALVAADLIDPITRLS